MQDIINFIDRYVGEDQLYWRIPTLYSQEVYEIIWNPGTTPWKIRLSDEDTWDYADSDELISELNKRQIDLVMFEIGLRRSALERIVISNIILDAGRDVFGDDIIDETIRQYQEFFDTLLETVNKTFEEETEKDPELDLEEIEPQVEEKPKVIRRSKGNVIKFPTPDTDK